MKNLKNKIALGTGGLLLLGGLASGCNTDRANMVWSSLGYTALDTAVGTAVNRGVNEIMSPQQQRQQVQKSRIVINLDTGERFRREGHNFTVISQNFNGKGYFPKKGYTVVFLEGNIVSEIHCLKKVDDDHYTIIKSYRPK